MYVCVYIYMCGPLTNIPEPADSNKLYRTPYITKQKLNLEEGKGLKTHVSANGEGLKNMHAAAI